MQIYKDDGPNVPHLKLHAVNVFRAPPAMSMDDIRRHFQEQADEIFRQLTASLPQGTLDRLFVWGAREFIDRCRQEGS